MWKKKTAFEASSAAGVGALAGVATKAAAAAGVPWLMSATGGYQGLPE